VTAAPAGAAPLIAPVRPVDVWLPHARFDHAKHTQLDCVSCHAAPTSVATADVLMPSKNTCATCHGPKGGVTDACTACHGYHNPRPAGLPTTADAPLPAALQRALAAAP
jgi:predicted CXXCH cytochrome family protein